jgi:NAD-specific glutamate dehydrogenase
MIKEAVAKNLSSKILIACVREDFELIAFQGQSRHVEGSTSKVQHKQSGFSIVFFWDFVSDGSSDGLIDDPEARETGTSTRVPHRLALDVVEVFEGQKPVTRRHTTGQQSWDLQTGTVTTPCITFSPR